MTEQAQRRFVSSIAGWDRSGAPEHAVSSGETRPAGGPIDLLLRDLGTNMHGLSPREAAKRLLVHGPNRLPRLRGNSPAVDLARRFVDPLALLLWVAAALSLSAGARGAGWAVVGVIVANAVATFWWDRQRDRTVDALERYLPTHARVVRSDTVAVVPATEVVPGDVVLLAGGERVSADVRLVSGGVEVDTLALTGRPEPVWRSAGGSDTADRLIDLSDAVFAGTVCTSGAASAVVFATGRHTELGRIAALAQRGRTGPSSLEWHVRRMAWLVACVAVVTGVLLLLGGLLAGLSGAGVRSLVTGLLVANVPEGLLLTITVALVVAVRALVGKGASVKRLSVVETLGSTTVICTDNAGTLTENRIRVVELWTPDGTSEPVANSPTFLRLAQAIADCADAESASDPLEVALRSSAKDLGAEPAPRVATYPFDSERERMSVVVRREDHLVVQVKGPPEGVLPMCTQHRIEGLVEPMTTTAHNAVVTAVDGLVARGLRVVAAASRRADLAEPRDASDAESELCLLGLVALLDPPRPDVADAVAACHGAGIRVHVVTAEDGRGATVLARQVGIRVTHVVDGSEVDAMSDAALDGLLVVPGESMFARCTPQAKQRIVESLGALGQVVAVTGDGVDDAPALRRAGIGFARDEAGTEVAREAASVQSRDDSFATIVTAVREGRRLYENLRKIVLYVFTHAVPQVAAFAVFALSGGAVPLPLTVLLVLAIDVGIEPLSAVALSREAAEPDVMDRPPRPRREQLVTRRLLRRAWLVMGPVAGALTLGMFFAVLTHAGWHSGDAVGSGTALHHAYRQATTMTFATILACQIGAAFAARVDRASVRAIGPRSNPLLLIAVAAEVLLAAAVIYLPGLQSVFGTAAPPAWALVLLVPCPVIVWGADECYRLIARRGRLPADSDSGRFFGSDS